VSKKVRSRSTACRIKAIASSRDGPRCCRRLR
jgi:hypothetical protein